MKRINLLLFDKKIKIFELFFHFSNKLVDVLNVEIPVVRPKILPILWRFRKLRTELVICTSPSYLCSETKMSAFNDHQNF